MISKLFLSQSCYFSLELDHAYPDEIAVSKQTMQLLRWLRVRAQRNANPHKKFVFAYHLPQQVVTLYELENCWRDLASKRADSAWESEYKEQADSIRRVLGMALPGSGVPTDQEIFLLLAIGKNPGDVLNWSAYRDFLLESVREQDNARGEVINAWSKSYHATNHVFTVG